MKYKNEYDAKNRRNGKYIPNITSIDYEITSVNFEEMKSEMTVEQYEEFFGVKLDCKPDMRNKVSEYIEELKDEHDKCVAEMGMKINDSYEINFPNAFTVREMTVRVQTIQEVINDLESRLAELV